MHFHARQCHRLQSIAQSHAGMGIRAWVKNYSSINSGSRANARNQFAFHIALEIIQHHAT